jgi:hypothetical protein
MKVLSLLQPWATLVINGAKKYECRNWKTNYRGGIIIHASARKPTRREKVLFEQSDYYRDYIQNMDDLPYGALIGKVLLTEIYTTEWLIQNLESDPYHYWDQELAFDDFSPKRFAWRLETPEAFEHILPIKGSLGLWEYNGLL